MADKGPRRSAAFQMYSSRCPLSSPPSSSVQVSRHGLRVVLTSGKYNLSVANRRSLSKYMFPPLLTPSFLCPACQDGELKIFYKYGNIIVSIQNYVFKTITCNFYILLLFCNILRIAQTDADGPLEIEARNNWP